MKAITLWQPWATLIAIGAKRFETRSWGTRYRGPLAIHAAKRPAVLGECNLDIRGALVRGGYGGLSSLPYGCIVCTVDLIACYNVGEVRFLGLLTDIEEQFGDYSPGRFAWRLDNVRQVDNIPARGSQGFWNWAVPEDLSL